MHLRTMGPHIVALVSLLFAGLALAAGQDFRVRGDVAAVSGSDIVVVTTRGEVVKVQLSPKLEVFSVSKTDLSAVSENSYIGVAAAPVGPNKVRALGLMVFPEGARGLNEGYFPWDLRKGSTMTNATVAKLVKKGKGAEVEVTFGGRTQTVLIDQATTFGEFVTGPRELLVVGAKVVVFASNGEDGSPVAHLIMVGKNGFQPPV
jgi:hypothetical protein